MMILVCIVGIILLLCFVLYLFPVIQVTGDSMYPTYRDGEIIFGYRFFKKSKLKVGDVVLYTRPIERRVVIKRIANIMYSHDGKMYLYCLGDNAECSHDSRNYGFISSKSLVCRVINQRRY